MSNVESSFLWQQAKSQFIYVLLYSCSSNIKSNLCLIYSNCVGKVELSKFYFFFLPLVSYWLIQGLVFSEGQTIWDSNSSSSDYFFPLDIQVNLHHPSFKNCHLLILCWFLSLPLFLHSACFSACFLDGALKNYDKPMLDHGEITDLFSKPLFQNL